MKGGQVNLRSMCATRISPVAECNYNEFVELRFIVSKVTSISLVDVQYRG